MIASLATLVLLQTAGPAIGDTWRVDRTIRYVNEDKGIDQTDVERLDYRIEKLVPASRTLQVTRTVVETRMGEERVPVPKGMEPEIRSVVLQRGAPEEREVEALHRVRVRIDRMQWAALEERSGISWNRRYPASAGLGAAKITVRPTKTEGEERTVAITYEEEGDVPVRGEGVAKVFGPKRLPRELKITLKGVVVPGGEEVVTAVVNQNLVENR